MSYPPSNLKEKFARLNQFTPSLKKIFNNNRFPFLFSPNLLASTEDLVAFSNDLNKEMLKEAYALGIFPWYETEPVKWYCPIKRMIFDFKNLKISPSFKKYYKKMTYEVSMDCNFEAVIDSCQKIKRKNQSGTWITQKLKQKFIELYQEGLAHSLEIKVKGELVGGLYGLSLGRAFFGESMFAKKSNASKLAFYLLYFFLKELNFNFIDGQAVNTHLSNLGARVVSKEHFLSYLYDSHQYPSLRGSWDNLFQAKKKQLLTKFQMIL